jgi:hypothetical protein
MDLAKTPPQPLPTRGRGYYRTSSASPLYLTVDASGVSPSPLWGGVGEGSSLLETLQ